MEENYSEPRNFEEDSSHEGKWDNKNIRESWSKIFKEVFGEGILITWKYDKVSQIDFGSDVLIQTKQGRKYSIDVKTRDNKYMGLQQWTIELFHQYYKDNTKKVHTRKKEGWLYCSTADYIFYGTINKESTKIIEYIGFSLSPFKDREFKQEITPLRIVFAPPTQYKNEWQLTGNAIMSFNFLKNNANKFWCSER